MRRFLAFAMLGICVVWGPAFAADIVSAPPAAPAPPVKQSGIWAAIAYSQVDAKHGFFWGADRREEAEKTALDHCRGADGDACRVVAVFRNHRHWDDDDDSGFPYHPCAALAVGKVDAGGTRPWGAESAPTRHDAEDLAMKACESDGEACRIREWVCT